MSSFLGLAFFHLLGTFVRAALGGLNWRQTIRSPASAWFGLTVLYGASLGLVGIGLMLGLGLWVWFSRKPIEQKTPPFLWPAIAVLAVVILARPWVPTMWDEFVWLSKSRLEALGFATGTHAALDLTQHLVPQGYPPLWATIVGWLSLGIDSLESDVTGGSIIVLLSAATAMEAWWERLRSTPRWLLAGLLATPMLWVHARSTYVDLPIGLLGLALLGHLIAGEFAVATVLAVMLSGLKDEGLAHVMAVSIGVFWVSSPRQLKLLAVPIAGVLTAGLWRVLTHLHGVVNEDHALTAPLWRWLPELGRLTMLHASDLATWGVFWSVALTSLLIAPGIESIRALRWALVLNFIFTSVALLCGPEQVRVFAENGTLLNRLLMQWWPYAAALVLLALPAYRSAPTRAQRATH